LKFNSQLLGDFAYVEKVKTCIEDIVSEYYLSGDVNDLLNVELTCNDSGVHVLRQSRLLHRA
jgi:hypothetical protein